MNNLITTHTQANTTWRLLSDVDTQRQTFLIGNDNDQDIFIVHGKDPETAPFGIRIPANSIYEAPYAMLGKIWVKATEGVAKITYAGSNTAEIYTFNPLDLNPILFLRASDTGTITESAGKVSQWDDQSTSGNNAVQATAAVQPSTGVDTINGRNVLTGGLSADTGLDLTTDINLTGDFDIFFVYETSNTTIEAGLCSNSGSGQSNVISLQGNGLFRIRVAGIESQEEPATTIPNVLNVWRVGSTVSYRVGRGTVRSFTASGTFPIGRVMRNRFLSEWLGKFGEMFVKDSSLSSDDRAAYLDYATSYWGTP